MGGGGGGGGGQELPLEKKLLIFEGKHFSIFQRQFFCPVSLIDHLKKGLREEIKNSTLFPPPG